MDFYNMCCIESLTSIIFICQVALSKEEIQEIIDEAKEKLRYF